MGIKEKFVDIGKRIIGKGEEVRFKDEVAKYEKLHGVSHEQAVKDIFLDRARNIQLEIGVNGIIDSESKFFKEFIAALNEVFGAEKVAQFRKDSINPKIFRNLSISPLTVVEVNFVKDYFLKKFKDRTPNLVIIKDCSYNMKLINAILQRFLNDPRLVRSNSIESIIVASPELRADLGKILEAKYAVERHERLFDKDLKFEKAIEKFKRTAENSLTEILWKAPIDYLTTIVKKGFNSKELGDFVGTFLKETAKFIGRETWAGTKFLSRSVYTVGSLIKNKVFR
jgi:hypothetical protein